MNPVLVEIFRSDKVESLHRGAVVVVNAAGEVIFELGDTSAFVFPRSSLKPIQAIPLIESGAAEHFALTEQELALACASHNAEENHQRVLAQWMQRIGLSPDQLECGPSLPLHESTTHQLLRDGGESEKRLHNCSGKHTGMLTLAKFLEVDSQGYSDYQHETQQRWMQVLSDLTGSDVFQYPWDRDGCGLPALAMPLVEFATALSSFCEPGKHAPRRGRAMQQILKAMQAHPELVAGTDRCCTAAMLAHQGVAVKTGAEGVFAAIAPVSGIAIALKIDDGATRAADAALGATLRKLAVIDEAQYESMQRWYSPEIKNSQGAVVGRLAPSAIWK